LSAAAGRSIRPPASNNIEGEKMVFNAIFNFCLWFVGCLHVIGCVGGLAFVVLFFVYCIRGVNDGNLFWFLRKDDFK
jgi:hypothetical protein